MADNFKPIIGKNVLETLTTGMYDDARFIFREYIHPHCSFWFAMC